MMATHWPETLAFALRTDLACKCRRRKRLDDAAIRDRAAATLRDHPIKLAAQSTEIGNLPINLKSMCSCDRIDCITRSASIVRKIQQCADLIEREAEVAGAADKAHSVEMFLAVGSVVSAVRAGFGMMPIFS